jgi:hypothetical protein
MVIPKRINSGISDSESLSMTPPPVHTYPSIKELGTLRIQKVIHGRPFTKPFNLMAGH